MEKVAIKIKKIIVFLLHEKPQRGRENYENKKIKLICVAILVGIIIIPVLFIRDNIKGKPVKYAINEEDIDKERGYIPFSLYKEAVMYDSNQYFGIYEYAVQFTPEGNVKEFNKLNSNVRAASNRYIFYGKYDETTANKLKAKGIYKKESQEDDGTPIFYVDDWEILYPIQRENDNKMWFKWFNPKGYLTEKDFK